MGWFPYLLCMLHITNGDVAADGIRATGLAGHVLPWRDVLHEGPVPANLSLDALSAVRARFIAELGWGRLDTVLREFEERDTVLATHRRHDEVVLWFEHDLYDQLQLLQLLDWFGRSENGNTRISIVMVSEYLGSMSTDALRDLFPHRTDVAPEQFALARDAWDAFRSATPMAITRLLQRDTSALPFLAAALRRHLEEFPSVSSGLSRSETQALEAVAAGKTHLQDTYRAAHHEREDAVFLGDTVFAAYLERMSQATPLVVFDDGERVRAPREPGSAFWNRRVALTPLGQDVLSQRADWIAIGAPERWLGGVRLTAPRVAWRWNPGAKRLEESQVPEGG